MRLKLKFCDKKAQITLFVILALVLIIIIGIIYFMFAKKVVIKEEFKEEAIPEVFKPVDNYVSSCIHQVGVEAIKKLGEHGGYVDPEDRYVSGKSFNIFHNSPSTSEFVSFSYEEILNPVPYYIYVPGKADSRNYVLASAIPTIEEMEEQVSRYMARELISCEGGFAELKEKGFDVIASPDINVVTRITSNDINLYVTQDIKMIKNDVQTNKSNFITIVRFPLLKYYYLAINITRDMFLQEFTEGFTEKLIDYYAGVDFTLLPPKGSITTHDLYAVTWNKQKVRMDLQGLLLSYVPSLQINNSKNYQQISGSGIDANFLKTSVLNTSIKPETLRNLEIDLLYLDQPIYLNINPSRGDLIAPSVFLDKPFSPLLPTEYEKEYRFFYDVSWPLIIIMREETNLEVDDFKYIFALESNIIENKALLEWLVGLGTVPYTYSDLKLTFDSSSIKIPTTSGGSIPYTMREFSYSLFCQPDSWISGDIKVKIEDKATGQPLNRTDIIFSCGTYDECWVGSTQLSTNGKTAEWVGKMPVCQGGYLTFSKEGYGSKAIMFSTQEGAGAMLATVKLDKIRELNAVIQKREVQKIFTRNSSWAWEAGPESIGPLQNIDNDNEQIILSITQVGADVGINPLTDTIVFGKEGVDKKTIKLVPGDYEVTANLIDYKGVYTPPNCTRICTSYLPVVGCTGYEYSPPQNVTMKPAPWGGIEINEETTGVLTITADQLDNNNEIEFRVVKLPDLKKTSPANGCFELLDEISKISDYSEKYKADIWPFFK